MIRIKNLIFSLIGLAFASVVGAQDATMEEMSEPQLQQQLLRIDAELEQQAKPTLRNGVGKMGWVSRINKKTSRNEWAKIQLGTETVIDQIVLTPIIIRDPKLGPQADGFPIEFKVIVGTGSNQKGTLLAHVTAEDQLLPRIAPVVIHIPPTKASWVKIKAIGLSRRSFENEFVCQLSEIMVFSGSENVALHKTIEVSSAKNNGDPCRQKETLVDGFTPYLIDSASGEKSDPFVVVLKKGKKFFLVIDLQAEYALNRVQLHLADFKENIPSPYHADYGLPRHMVIDGANRPDFSDAVELLDYRRETIYDAGPVISRALHETTCRYVRFTVLEAYSDPALPFANVGFAEIELFAGDRNVALGKIPTFRSGRISSTRSHAALTDGRNHYGNLLPAREWMDQLARRHDLEVERPLIIAELNVRHERQKIHLRHMSWLAALLAVIIGFTIMIGRLLRQHAVAKSRERIAANLHDELGANLHAIGMLGDLAKSEADASERLKEIVSRIRELTERTGKAARSCTNMLESRDIGANLIDEMKGASYRLLADVDHEISFHGEEFIRGITPHRQVDLFLFYKEFLTNTLRHSGATRIATSLSASSKEICLQITDNGHGMSNGEVPRSLKRRARLLHAKLTVKAPDGGGMEITLRLRLSRFGF